MGKASTDKARFLILLLFFLCTKTPSAAGTIEGRVEASKPGADLLDFVVYVEDIEGSFIPPPEPAVMDQEGLKFVPHVLVVLLGTTVQFPNSDPVLHNVFSISEAKRFNLGLYQRGTIRQVKFDRPGVVEVLCNVHLEMSGYILVVNNPFFTKTGADGHFTIRDIPPGRYRLRCWHEPFAIQEQDVEVPPSGAVEVVFRVELQEK